MSLSADTTDSGRASVARGLVVWVALVALYVAVRLPLLAVPLERDEGLFGVIGQVVLRGEVPYRDVFEHKPPGVFYVYAFALLFVPPTAVGVHAFLAVWNFATTLAVGALGGAIAGASAAAWAVLLFIVASAALSVQGFSATTEMVLLLPLTLSVLLAVRASASAGWRRSGLLAASGALAAATFWIKQPAVLAAAAGPLAIILDHRGAARGGARPLDLGGAARDLVPWTAGAAALTLVATVPFALLGVWGEFWYWAFTHSWLYGQLPVTHWTARLAGSVLNVGRDLGFAVALGVAGGVVGLRRGRRGAGVALGFLVLSIASAFQSRFFYTHYFALLAPAVAVAGGTGLAWMQESAGRRSRTFAIAATLLVIGMPLATRSWYWLWPDPVAISLRTLGPQGFDAAPLVADYLRQRTTPDDRLFVYGSEPEIPFLAGRRDVNPFGMVYPLTWTWPRHREFQERAWARIDAGRPTYIVLARNPWSLVRSPEVDPFFEHRLTTLGQQAYRLETVLIGEPGGGFRFAPGPDGNGQVVFELWRRTPEGP